MTSHVRLLALNGSPTLTLGTISRAELPVPCPHTEAVNQSILAEQVNPLPVFALHLLRKHLGGPR